MRSWKSSKCSKNLTSVKNRKGIFLKMSKYRNTVFYDYQSRFLVIFSSNYRHRLVLNVPFPDHIFSKISNYRTENLYFPSIARMINKSSHRMDDQQKQPTEVFCKKRCSWKFCKIHKKTPVPENPAKFLKTTFLQNRSGQLLLDQVDCFFMFITNSSYFSPMNCY